MNAARIRPSLQQHINHLWPAHAPCSLVQGGHDPGCFSPHGRIIEVIRPRPVRQQHPHRHDVMEIHGAQQRIGAPRVRPRLQQHPQPLVMAKLGRVIERLAIVGIGAVRQQPAPQNHVVGMPDCTVKHREPVRAARPGRAPVIHICPVGHKHLGNGDHVTLALGLRVDALRKGQEANRRLMRHHARRPARILCQHPRHGVTLEQRHLQPEHPFGQVRRFRQQPVDAGILSMGQRDFQTLKPCRPVHALQLHRVFQCGPTGKACLLRDHVKVVRVLQHSPGLTRRMHGQALQGNGVSGRMGLLQRLGIAAQLVEGFHRRFPHETPTGPLIRA